ncbi:hypothetical protein BGZ76_000817 [Entomortierella beljakovae]|nr:hypothetical protein BGZ76_000817 [Entomortierella beljakovae]
MKLFTILCAALALSTIVSAEKCRTDGECGINCKCIGFTNGAGGVVGYREGNCECIKVGYLKDAEKRCMAKVNSVGCRFFLENTDENGTRYCHCDTKCKDLWDKLASCRNQASKRKLPQCPTDEKCHVIIGRQGPIESLESITPEQLMYLEQELGGSLLSNGLISPKTCPLGNSEEYNYKLRCPTKGLVDCTTIKPECFGDGGKSACDAARARAKECGDDIFINP